MTASSELATAPPEAEMPGSALRQCIGQLNAQIRVISRIEAERDLAAIRPSMGRYAWIWWVLHARANMKEGPMARRFPNRLFGQLQRFLRRDAPYFVGRTEDGTVFIGDHRDGYALWSAVFRNHDEDVIALVRQRLGRRRPGLYLDVGCNMGVVAFSLARYLGKESAVVGFEPMPHTFARASAGVAVNRLENVFLIGAAVGESNESVLMHQPFATGATAEPNSQHSAGSTLHRTEFEGISWRTTAVPSLRLDDLQHPALQPVIFLKIDVEGNEVSVIRGAREMIARDRPLILYEFNPKLAAAAGWDLSVMESELRPLGYAFSYLLEDGTTQVTPPGTSPNDPTFNVCCETTV